MNAIFYIAIFIIGTVFGSFYTLAVYRIPKRQDITHTHSYCPKCEHKLGFFDLIPVWSYIFLGGKCRYCKEKIRPRYFILEALSGILFLTVAYFMKLNLTNITIIKVIDYAFFALYFTFIVLMAGIDKEKREINRDALAYGIILSILYMIYLYIIEKNSIYRYIIYLVLYVIILLVDNITLKKYAKNKYITLLLLVVIIMAIITGEFVAYESVIITLISIALDTIVHKIKNKKEKKQENYLQKEQIGYMLGISNMIIFVFILICNYYLKI